MVILSIILAGILIFIDWLKWGYPSIYIYFMTMAHWFDKSSTGKSYLLSSLDELNRIYRNINLSSNSSFPKLQLTIQEESMMRSFYHSKIRDICGALDYSFMVEYDAHMLLHKYFLKYGILENDVMHAM